MYIFSEVIAMTENNGARQEDANSRAERRKRDPIGQILDLLSNSDGNSSKQSGQPIVTSAHAVLPPVHSMLPQSDHDKSHLQLIITDPIVNTRTIHHQQSPQSMPTVAVHETGTYLLDEGSAFRPFAKCDPKTASTEICNKIIPIDFNRNISFINSYANAHLLTAQNFQMSVQQGHLHGPSGYPVQCPAISGDIIAKMHMTNLFQQSYGYPTPFDITGNMNMFSLLGKKISSDSSFNPACILTSDSSGSHVTQTPPRYHCDSCKKSYSTYGGLSKHKQFHCVNQVKKEFSCKFCGKCYGSLGALKMHIRTHTLPCKCKICGKAFSRPWLLQGHIRTHTGEKPFRCDHCSRAFADRSNLRAHLQTHSEVKKYACKSCNKTFSRMSLLVKHRENHCYSR